MNKKQFWTQKPILAEYESVSFSNSSFDSTIYLVANQFAPVTLGGVVHTPCPMEVKPPNQSKDGNPAITLSFPRVVVGAEFKKQIKKITTYEPIVVTYRTYFADDMTNPVREYVLYVDSKDGIAMNGQAVNVKATIDNPMRRNVSRIYDPAEYTGLKAL